MVAGEGGKLCIYYIFASVCQCLWNGAVCLDKCYLPHTKHGLVGSERRGGDQPHPTRPHHTPPHPTATHPTTPPHYAPPHLAAHTVPRLAPPQPLTYILLYVFPGMDIPSGLNILPLKRKVYICMLSQEYLSTTAYLTSDFCPCHTLLYVYLCPPCSLPIRLFL